MDKKDELIIHSLRENAKLSTQEISRRTSIPITTVHNRIKKLEKEGVIKGYTVNLDFEKFGRPITAFILMNLDYHMLKESSSTQDRLVKSISLHPEVESVSLVTGAFDIIIKIRVGDVKEFDDFITHKLRKHDGIGSTQTLIAFREI